MRSRRSSALQKVFAVSTRYEGDVRGVHVSIDGTSVGNAARVWVAATAPNGSDVALNVGASECSPPGERLRTADAAFDALFSLHCVPEDAPTALALGRRRGARLPPFASRASRPPRERRRASLRVLSGRTRRLAYVVEAAVELVRALKRTSPAALPPARMRVDDAAGAFLWEAPHTRPRRARAPRCGRAESSAEASGPWAWHS